MHCWARYLFIAVVSVLATGHMIAACGQKGDLYLPEPEQEAQQEEATDTDVDPVPQIEGDESQAAEAEAATASEVPRPGQE